MKKDIEKPTNTSCPINNGIDFNSMIKSMEKYPIKKIRLSNLMKRNLDKLGVKYAK